jgi:hypothetical protein
MSIKPLPPRKYVRGDAFIGMTNVWRAIGVWNGGSDHIGGTIRHKIDLARFLQLGKLCAYQEFY